MKKIILIAGLALSCGTSPSQLKKSQAALTSSSSSQLCLDPIAYGVVVNDGIDHLAQLQEWLEAQDTLTPGCDLPFGTISIAQDPLPGTSHIPSIKVSGDHKRLWGAGPGQTTIEMIGGSTNDWTLINVIGEHHVLGNFTLSGANRGVTPSEQTHLLQVTGPAKNVRISDAEFYLPQQEGNHGGDCIRFLGSEPIGEPAKIVDGVVMERLFAPECDRSFVGVQRGTYNVWASHLVSVVVGDAAIDFELTGQGEAAHITIVDSELYTGHGGRFATPGGNNTYARNVVFDRVSTDGGGFFAYRLAESTFRDLRIVVDATAPDHTPLAAIKEGSGNKIEGGYYERTGVAGPVLSFAAHAGSYPTNVKIDGATIVQRTAAPAIKASPITGLNVSGAVIECAGPTANTESAILVDNAQAISRDIRVHDSTFLGNCQYALRVGASPDVVFTDNVARVGTAAVRVNSAAPKLPIVDGNSITSSTLGVAPLAVSPITQLFVGVNSL